jgi:hypothetical protein
MSTNPPPGGWPPSQPPEPPQPGPAFYSQPPGPPSYGPPPAVPRHPWWRQRKWLAVSAAAALAVAAVVIGVLASSGPGNFTARGTVTVCGDLLGGTSATDAYPDITDGGQVTVTDSASHVIGTSSLSLKSSTTLMDDYMFRVTVAGGEARYGIEVGQNRGTVWFSETQMRTGPSLSLGC